MSTLVVIAKECLPGRVKTRLGPVFTPEQAAGIAAACLADTLDAARLVRCDRRILYFVGRPPAGLRGFAVVPQPNGTLDMRLGALFDRARDRTLLIGMDTPQVDPAVLQSVFDDRSGADTWFGRAVDGGFWALGMDRPDGRLIRGVTMSQPTTGGRQLARLRGTGRRIAHLPALEDVDTPDAAARVAAAVPDSRLATTIRGLGRAA